MAEVNKWAEALKASFDSMRSGPKKLLTRFQLELEEQGLKGSPIKVLSEALKDKDDLLREELHARLSQWDFQANAAWTKTHPNTADRRADVYRLLELPAPLVSALEQHLPPRIDDVEREVVITEHGTTRWYSDDFCRGREFYWPRYREYLKTNKKFSEETLSGLHESSSRVVESLAPPHSAKPDARRGLVVGYVQSGKTTNFTAVVAKAIDAGYRLIIVLAGTIDILRLQTQRRLDMELVGLENLNIDLEDPEREYQNDSAFPSRFIRYGALPRTMGAPNIKRLTNSAGDFRTLHASFQALAFDELGGSEKAYLPDAIKKTNVRLIVIKKVTPRLKKLVKEIKSNRGVREHLPTLIIDDESDQASVNTVKPNAALERERSKTNGLIVELLELLPRAQYVGYTATPFANVLVNPVDAADIYPRDFIISLPRPAGYMGVSDFHDIGRTDELTPNKNAFVRQFEDDDADVGLTAAMDAFVVSGAIKLFRKSKGVDGDFRHHTMMVHESVRNQDQFEQERHLNLLWRRAGYSSTGNGPARLRKALEEDFRRVWREQAPSLPFPNSYEELKPFVAETLKLVSMESPVIVVNGDEDGVDPKFDTTEHVWRIIVGGAKLSRGFTVEGLTVTYFARRSKSQDTMMQMGRWFGYRGGYRDLVRLYLEKGSDEKFDLYEAFESICRDEEDFRAQLTKYSQPDGTGRRMRPIELPAVVYNSFPGVMPTARNKMFNAELVEAALNDEWKEKTDVPTSEADLKVNWGLLARLIGPELRSVSIGSNPFLIASVKKDAVVKFLQDLKWRDGRVVLAAERYFLQSNVHAVKDWVVAFPLLSERIGPKLASQPLSIHMRGRKNGSYKAFTGSKQRDLVRAASQSSSGPLAGKGVLLVYPTHPKEEPAPAFPVVGFGLYHPAIPASAVKVVFTVRDKSRSDDVVIAA